MVENLKLGLVKILKLKFSRNADVLFNLRSVVSLAMFLEEIEIKSCYATRGVSDNAGQPLANPRLVGAGQYKDEHARGKQAHLNSTLPRGLCMVFPVSS